jgi:hypothetical protein
MISWLLQTAHPIPEIDLRFMRGLYDGHERPLRSITIHLLFILLCFRVFNPKIPNNLF